MADAKEQGKAAGGHKKRKKTSPTPNTYNDYAEHEMTCTGGEKKSISNEASFQTLSSSLLSSKSSLVIPSDSAIFSLNIEDKSTAIALEASTLEQSASLATMGIHLLLSNAYTASIEGMLDHKKELRAFAKEVGNRFFVHGIATLKARLMKNVTISSSLSNVLTEWGDDIEKGSMLQSNDFTSESQLKLSDDEKACAKSMVIDIFRAYLQMAKVGLQIFEGKLYHINMAFEKENDQREAMKDAYDKGMKKLAMEVGGLFFHKGFFEWDGLVKVKALEDHKLTLLKWKDDLAMGANAD